MRAAEIRRLAELGGACGESVRIWKGTPRRRSRRLCVRPAGHAGPCSGEWERGPVSETERLRRRLAKKSVLAERRDRSEEHLRERIRYLESRRAWVESFVGFRIEYRLRGGWRRVKRWRRQARWAIRHRMLSGWRW